MRAEIIVTGSELLTGGTIDTNSAFLADELLELGIETAFKTAVGDNDKDLEDAFKRARERCEIMVVTGGLGPTEDDITRRVLARILKKRLILSEDALRSIQAVFAAKGRVHPAASDRQALIPAGARMLRNPVGVAPGFFLQEEKKLVAVLPGVPAEMRAMYREELRPVLEEYRGKDLFICRKILHTCGLTESRVNGLLEEVLRQKQPTVGLSAGEGQVDVRILARDRTAARALRSAEKTETAVRKKLGDAVFGVNGQTLEDIMGALLIQRTLTLAVAESCTGGMIGSRITNIAGSSEYFERGVVTYSNEAKTELLGVPAELIERRGAVSREVATAMALGIRERAGTDLGLAVTGIAGPGGGTPEKPVGLVYLALAWERGKKVDEHRFLGTRDQVRQRTAQAALDMVRRYLIA
jgi:nicotinamide-nucleotide amidase